MLFAVMGMALPLFAQSAAAAAVFAPFVSRLEGEIRSNLVRISWVDSQHARGPVTLYRSTSPFDSPGPFADARLVEIPYGVQFYVDEIEAGPGQGRTIYYFAAASDEAGRIYDVPIVSTNTISIRTPPSSVPEIRETGIRETTAPQTRGISALQAVVQGDRVIISFGASAQGAENTVLYRSVHPIRQTQDLLAAVIVQTGIQSPFTDYPAAGIPYHYAVIFEDDLIRGSVQIIPGRNATEAPVQISPTGADPAGPAIRAIPLPQVSVQGAIPDLRSHPEIPAIRDLSPEALRALEMIPARPTAAPKSPRVFARDLALSRTAGEDYTLSLIVRGPFAAREWETARDQLLRFLALPRSPDVHARARFYLGQSRYFLFQPREGLFDFLAIEERYPTEAREWIQASLEMMRN